MALVLLKEVQQSEWGTWLHEAMALTYLPEQASREPVFPVISLSRRLLTRAFDEAEIAQLTDQDIAQIAAEMGSGFSLDPGFWYAVDMMGRRLLEAKAYLPRNWEYLHEANSGDGTDRGESNFSAWMQAVDRCVWLVAGCSIHDLPDCDFRTLFEDGVPPAEMANEALQIAGFEMLE